MCARAVSIIPGLLRSMNRGQESLKQTQIKARTMKWMLILSWVFFIVYTDQLKQWVPNPKLQQQQGQNCHKQGNHTKLKLSSSIHFMVLALICVCFKDSCPRFIERSKPGIIDTALAHIGGSYHPINPHLDHFLPHD
ncbi:hypothetical protein LXL04_037232 [Taraxacum kok-saghyz]